MPKFTPGPWTAFLLSLEAEILAHGSKDVRIADVFCGTSFTGMGDYYVSEKECHANARLIAAAPEMYEALKECVYQIHLAYSRIPGFPDDAKQAFDNGLAALALANGGKDA